MATLQQIRESVRRKLIDSESTAFSDSVLNEEINRSIKYYSRSRFYFNETLSTITLTAGAQVVPSIPSDLQSELQVNGLMLIDNQVKIDLEKLLPDVFFENDYEQTGRPIYYTYRNDQFLLLPIPQEAYSLILRYLKTYSDLSADSDTNDFTDNASDLIMLHTLKNMYNEDKQDLENGARYQELERMELLSLKERDKSRLGTGQLYAETILN